MNILKRTEFQGNSHREVKIITVNCNLVVENAKEEKAIQTFVQECGLSGIPDYQYDGVEEFNVIRELINTILGDLNVVIKDEILFIDNERNHFPFIKWKIE